MNKKDLVFATTEALKRANEINGLTMKSVAAVIDAFCDVAAAELLGGGEVPMHGLGKLFVKERSARSGRNPRTGNSITIPACKVVRFNPAKALKDALK